MALEGFTKVAVVRYGTREFHFALYDDDIAVGDTVYLSGGSTPTQVVNIITKEKANKSITQEVICKIDMSAYEKRVADREEKVKLKKLLDKRKKEIQKSREDSYYAEIDDEFRELLNKYNTL